MPPKKRRTQKANNLLRKILLTTLAAGAGYQISEQNYTPPQTTIGTIVDEEDIHAYFSPRGECERALIDAIDEAQETIHIYIFSFTLKSVAQALRRAKDRGVTIHIITDNMMVNGKSSQIPKIHRWVDKLYIDHRTGVGHHKFIVVDRETVITGSFNYSTSAQKTNREGIVRIDNREVANRYYQEWERQKAASKVDPYGQLH